MASRVVEPRFAVLLVLVTALSAVSAVAHAQAEQAAEKAALEARTLFREARELVKEQKYARACPKFERSLTIERGIGTMYNLADCWEKLGRLASAHALFASTAEAARSMGQAER